MVVGVVVVSRCVGLEIKFSLQSSQQDILDKLNPELLNIKAWTISEHIALGDISLEDHEQRLSESVNQLMDRIPGSLGVGKRQFFLRSDALCS